jgi:transposase
MSAIALLTDYHNYFLYSGHADMRKSIDGLCGIVHNELGREVNQRDVFIFLNRRCTHIKLLLHESDGFTLLFRRLHKGRFKVPTAGETSQMASRLSATELVSMLSGLHLYRARKRA